MSQTAKIAGMVPAGVQSGCYSLERGQRKHRCKYSAGQGIKDPNCTSSCTCSPVFKTVYLLSTRAEIRSQLVFLKDIATPRHYSITKDRKKLKI